jgi:hypothetical protein
MATAHTIVEKFDVDDVIDWYDNQKESAFKIFVGFKEDYCRYEYDGNDKEEGCSSLIQYLNDIKKNTENTNKYLLQVYGGAKSGKSSTKKGITFQLNRSASSVGSVSSGNDLVMREVLNELRELRAERFNRDIEDAEGEEEEEKPQGILAGLMAQPQIQTMIMQIVGNIAAAFVKPMPNTKLAGVDDGDIEKILQILFDKGVTIDDLGKLASMDKSQITMLLTMLRK